MPSKTIKLLLHDTLLTSKKSVNQLADETGMSSSYLYRACNPEDESNARFPLDYLLPLMLATKNYSVIKHLANLCGFILIELPKPCANNKEKNKFVSEYQQCTLDATKHLMAFFEDPTENNFKSATVSLLKVLENSATAKHLVEKEYSGQFEMNL